MTRSRSVRPIYIATRIRANTRPVVEKNRGKVLFVRLGAEKLEHSFQCRLCYVQELDPTAWIASASFSTSLEASRECVVPEQLKHMEIRQ
jgi:hypothetical protein